MGLDQHQALEEAHGGGVGARHQAPAHELPGQRVERAGDLGVLVAGHLGLAPQRQVVARGGRGQQGGALHRLEVLARPALGGAMAAHPVVVLAPVAGMGAGHLHVLQVLAGEAVVPDIAHRARDRSGSHGPGRTRGRRG